MPRDAIGAVHVVCALLSLLLGLLIFLGAKGTARHKLLGWGYAIAIIAVNASALLIYRLNGHFTVFHAGAVVSLITTVGGLSVIRSPKPERIRIHYFWMCASYLGLLAALVAELLTRAVVPLLPGHGMQYIGFWVLATLSGSLISLFGIRIIARKAPQR